LKVTKRGWWSGSRGKSAYLASTRHLVQTPVLPKKKKKRERERKMLPRK
jgi:hypothetical protein